MNSMKRIVSIIFGILLMFVASQLYFSIKGDILTQEYVKQETEAFANIICEHGYLSQSQLTQFENKLSNTSNLYDIQISHEKLCLEPEYRFKTIEEILEDQNKTYKGTNIYTYTEVKSDSPPVDDHEPEDLSMTTETNASVMAKATNTGASSSHIHSPQCYDGHVHNGEAFITVNHSHTSSCERYLRATRVKYDCTHCSKNLSKVVSFSYLDSSGNLNYYNSEGIYDGSGTNTLACINCGNQVPRTTYQFTYLWDYQCGHGLDEYYGYTYAYINSHGGYLSLLQAGAYDFDHQVEVGVNYTYKIHDTAARFYWGHSYVNGCHEFHRQRLPMDGYWSSSGNYLAFSKYNGEYWDSTPPTLNILYNLKNYGPLYCAVPKYYSFNYIGRDYTTDYDCYAQYSIELQLDKSFLFRLSSITYYKYTYGIDSSWQPISSCPFNWSNLPQTMTMNEMYQTMSDVFTFVYSHIPKIPEQYPSFDYFRELGNTNDNPYIYSHGTFLLCNEGNGSIKEDGKWYTTCGQEEDGTCNCGNIITSIIPTHPTQTIYAGDPMVTTVQITYRDGSVCTDIASCDFNTLSLGLNQTVTLYLIGNDTATTTKRFENNVSISVIAKTMRCSNGHTYHISADGSNPGCPYCMAWVKTLSVYQPASGYLEIRQGTTLESNGVVLLVTYFDGRNEYVTSGYANNLDPVYIGAQTVTIGYKGKFVHLNVRVNRKQKLCTICGKYYELYPDGSDPGCPYCLTKTPVFTGKVIKYYSEYYKDEIYSEIEANGSYHMSKGDELQISVSNKNTTLATKILNFLGVGGQSSIKVFKSATIRDMKR